MAKIYSPEQQAALRHYRIEPAFLLDLFTDTTSLHCSSLYIPLNYDVGDGVARDYEPMQGRWSHGSEPISMGSDLTPEPIRIEMDASRVSDPEDFVGRFADSAWHRRRARFSIVTFAVDTNFAVPIDTLMTYEGNMDYREFPLQADKPPIMTLTIESGTFMYNRTNMQTRTDENQQRLFAGDKFFQDVGVLIGRDVPWHRTWVSGSPSSGGPPLFSNPSNREYPSLW